ncbi:MAG TPA: hypothetical protein VER96_04690 [Polyangiaceae bacterium]|nr:hypothetical protein [Polyangiaceae bacterium]
MSERIRLALGLAVSALSVASYGCSGTSTCSRHEDYVDVYGYVNEDRTIFSSADPEKLPLLDAGKLPDGVDGPLPSFTYFPANRTITFHIGLAGYPTTITPYLAFVPDGDRTVAPCAGNQCLIRKRNKDEIVLRNDTCSEFYVWLTASTSATPFHELTDAGVVDASDADSTAAAGAENTP